MPAPNTPNWPVPVTKIHCGPVPPPPERFFCIIDNRWKKFEEGRERKHRYRELCRARNLAQLKP
jgi:hypothetical protein